MPPNGARAKPADKTQWSLKKSQLEENKISRSTSLTLELKGYGMKAI
jgi:hypothetical protein